MTAINEPAIKANGIEIPTINSPTLGMLPISPKRNMNRPMKIIMPTGAKGAVKKLKNFFALKRSASVKPGFSPRANCSAAIRHRLPPAMEITASSITKNMMQ